MKRFYIPFIIIFILFTSSTVLADNSYMSYEALRIKIFENNTSLKKLRDSESSIRKQYESVSEAVKNIDINKIKESMSFFGNQLDNYSEMMMVKQTELVPKQLEYEYIKAQNARFITGRTLELSLRNMYCTLISQDSSLKVLSEKLKVSESNYEADKKEYKQGLISSLKLQESEYNKLKIKNEYDIAVREKNKICRQINRLVNLSVDNVYSPVNYDETISDEKLSPQEYYIEKALKERFEVIDINKQIELKKLQVEILELFDIYKRFTPEEHEHRQCLLELKQLNSESEKVKLNIENEIKSAYTEILKERLDIDALQSTINNQKKHMEKIKLQVENGFLNKSVLNERNIDLTELEKNYELMIYSYNTKLLKFNYATGAGPSYLGGY